MFEKIKDKIKDKIRQQQEEQESRIREEKDRLLSLSEKELLVEILLELRRVDDKISNVETSIHTYSNRDAFLKD